jgi:hypothetical protein
MVGVGIQRLLSRLEAVGSTEDHPDKRTMACSAASRSNVKRTQAYHEDTFAFGVEKKTFRSNFRAVGTVTN